MFDFCRVMLECIPLRFLIHKDINSVPLASTFKANHFHSTKTYYTTSAKSTHRNRIFVMMNISLWHAYMQYC